MSYLGHALVENRNGLIAAAKVTHADGYAERDAALLMLAQEQEGRSRRITVGADKGYDTKDFVNTVREWNVTPHVTRNDKGRRSNLDRRTTRQPCYAISLSRRLSGKATIRPSGMLTSAVTDPRSPVTD